MVELPKNLSLLEHSNGVAEPLYFDRQIIRASDLNLGRESRNAELDRMRRYALGTGVVAGLTLKLDRNRVMLTGGYGVSPSGNEVFLEQDLELGDLDKAIKELCAASAGSCELDDTDDAGTPAVWLLIRPKLSEADKRAGVADTCGHPANVMRPARACHTVEVLALKELPEHLRLRNPTCDDRNPFVCDSRAVENIEIPQAYDPDRDVLVLGRVTVIDGEIDIEMIERRRLLPAQLVQEWIMACLCGADPTVPTEEEEISVETWLEFDDLLVDNGYASELTKRPGRDVVRLPEIDGPPAFMTEKGIIALEEKGIVNPAAFMNADIGELAETLELEVKDATNLRRELERLSKALRLKA